MPFKIACGYADPTNSFIPTEEMLKQYIAWLRREIAVATAELDARLHPKPVDVPVVAWEAVWDGKKTSLKPLPNLPAKKPAKKKAGAK